MMTLIWKENGINKGINIGNSKHLSVIPYTCIGPTLLVVVGKVVSNNVILV